MVEYDHKTLLPPTKPEYDTTLCTFLGSFRHEANTSVRATHQRVSDFGHRAGGQNQFVPKNRFLIEKGLFRGRTVQNRIV
jgi:hypothetical protein